MIAVNDRKRLTELERPERAHFATGIDQRLPERSSRLADAADPVTHHSNLHAGLGTFHECVEERPAGFIIPNDVVLEQDAGFGVADRGQPGVVVGASVDQQFDMVSANQRRTCSAAEGMRGHLARYIADQRRVMAMAVGVHGRSLHSGVEALVHAPRKWRVVDIMRVLFWRTHANHWL